MKKKLLTILCAFCLILPFMFMFTGCGQNQITMVQIHSAFSKLQNPTVDGVGKLSLLKDENVTNIDYAAETMLRWQRNFERNNIDSEKLMAVDFYYFYNMDDGHTDYPIYVFKFSEDKYAGNCKSNFDFYRQLGFKVEKRQYGNLVVVIESKLSNFAFNIIDNIK